MDGPPPPPGRPMERGGNRLYLGNLPPSATKADIENHFASGGGNRIAEVKLMTGFGFVEYQDAADASDAVDRFNGSDMMGSRLNVQFARGGRERREPFFNDRPAPRTRRTIYRLNLTGLPAETSWQDLKDFARLEGLDVVYSEIGRGRDGTGFVEYETEDDLNNAAQKLDGVDFRGGAIISAVPAIQSEMPSSGRFRSRSPGPRRGGGYGGGRGGGRYGGDDYDRRGPPRGYGDDRGYRERSPPPRRYDDDYDRRGPPPGRGYGGGGRDDYGGGPVRRGGGAYDDFDRRGRSDDYHRGGRGGGGGGGRYDEPYGGGRDGGRDFDGERGPPMRGGDRDFDGDRGGGFRGGRGGGGRDGPPRDRY